MDVAPETESWPPLRADWRDVSVMHPRRPEYEAGYAIPPLNSTAAFDAAAALCQLPYKEVESVYLPDDVRIRRVLLDILFRAQASFADKQSIDQFAAMLDLAEHGSVRVQRVRQNRKEFWFAGVKGPELSLDADHLSVREEVKTSSQASKIVRQFAATTLRTDNDDGWKSGCNSFFRRRFGAKVSDLKTNPDQPAKVLIDAVQLPLAYADQANVFLAGEMEWAQCPAREWLTSHRPSHFGNFFNFSASDVARIRTTLMRNQSLSVSDQELLAMWERSTTRITLHTLLGLMAKRVTL